MRCQRAQSKLMAYHDSELSAGASRRLEKHLETCDECRQLLENLRLADHHASQSDGINSLVGVPEMPPPGDRYWESFTARVLDRVEEDAATRAPERKKSSRGWNLFTPWLVPAFSAALVVVVAAGVLMKAGIRTPVMKVPGPSVESAREKEIRVQEALPAKSESVETESKTDTGTQESEKPVLDKHVQADETFRPAPSAESGPLPSAKPRTAPEPESSSAEMPAKTVQAKVAEEKPAPRTVVTAAKNATDKGTVDVKKKAALAEPMTPARTDEVETSSAPVPLADTAPAGVESRVVSSQVEERTEADAPSKPAAKAAARPSPETLPDSTPVAVAPVNPDQQGEPLSAAAGMDGSLEQAPVTDGQEQGGAAAAPGVVTSAPSAEPLIEGYTADADPGSEMETTTGGNIGSVTSRSKSPAIDEIKSSFAEPERPVERSAAEEMPDFSGDSEPVVSGGKALDSTVPGIGTRQSFGSGLPYRGPEDQLNHAERLAEVRKFWESEQVLKNLISQDPPTPIREEAFILLVKVLSDQNRVSEAQQTLDDAKIQFPSNDVIQNFELNIDGGRPAQ